MTSDARSLPRTLSVVLTALLALAMAALAVLSNWADAKEREIIGPVAVKAGPEGQVFVVSHGALWVLDRQGSLSSSVPLEVLDIHGRVSDVLPMGGGEILIAERGPGLVHRCRLADRACVPFTTDARGTRLEGSFELAADDDRSHVYLAHTTRHAIHLFDGSGNWLATSDAAGLYKFPHRPVVVAGALYVADTNHHRLVAIDREPARFGEKVDSFSTETPLGSRGRMYPIAHRRLPDGTWWVVIGDPRLQYADIIVFDSSGNPLRRLDLPVDASPVALEVVDELVLAPDPVNLRVDAFTLTGQSGRRVWRPGLPRRAHASADPQEHVQVASLRLLGSPRGALAGVAGHSAGRDPEREEEHVVGAPGRCAAGAGLAERPWPCQALGNWSALRGPDRPRGRALRRLRCHPRRHVWHRDGAVPCLARRRRAGARRPRAADRRPRAADRQEVTRET